MRFAIIVAVVGLLFSCSSPSENEEVDVPGIRVSKDSTVIEASPDSNYGTYQTITAGHSNLGDPDVDGNYFVYLYFDLSDIPSGSTVTSVDLRLYVSNTINNIGSDMAFDIYSCNEAWSEYGITYASQPTSDYVATFLAPSDGYRGWVSIKLDGLISVVQTWIDDPATNHGLCIKPDFVSSSGYSNRLDFGSRESIYDPNIVVEYTTP